MNIPKVTAGISANIVRNPDTDLLYWASFIPLLTARASIELLDGVEKRILGLSSHSPQCLHFLASGNISSAQNGHFILSKLFTSLIGFIVEDVKSPPLAMAYATYRSFDR